MESETQIETRKCDYCKGLGKTWRTLLGREPYMGHCDYCNGTGKITARFPVPKQTEVIPEEKTAAKDDPRTEPFGEHNGRPINRLGEYKNSREHDEGYY